MLADLLRGGVDAWGEVLAEAVAEGAEGAAEDGDGIRNAKRGKGGKERMKPKMVRGDDCGTSTPGHNKFKPGNTCGSADYETSPPKDWVPDSPRRAIKAADALAELKAGATVTSPLGIDVRATADGLMAHWKGKPRAEITRRLKDWAEAKETLRHPHEIWEDAGQLTFLRRYHGSGMVAWAAVGKESGELVTYRANEQLRNLGRHQKGTLKWSRKKKVGPDGRGASPV